MITIDYATLFTTFAVLMRQMWQGMHKSLCLPNGGMTPPLPEGWSHADKLKPHSRQTVANWKLWEMLPAMNPNSFKMPPEDMYAAMLDVQNMEEVRAKQLEVNRLLPGRAFVLRCFVL